MPEPIALTWTVTDQAGKSATFTEFVADNLTLAQLSEGVVTHAPRVDGILSGIIGGVEACFGVDLSGLTGNAVGSTADVEEVGEFIFSTAQNRDIEINLPCINDTASVAGSDDLDQTDPNVSAFIDAIVNGLTTPGGNLAPTDVDENDIVTIVTATERVKNSGSRG